MGAVGGAVGGVAIIVALVGLVVLLRRRKRAKPPAVVTVQTTDVEMTSTSAADPFPSSGLPESSSSQVSKSGGSAQLADTTVGQLMSQPVYPLVVGAAVAQAMPAHSHFPMHEWEYASSELDWGNGHVVGRGAFGVVYAVPCASLRIAAKRMDVMVGRQRADIERLLLREFRVLQKAMHANVVRVLGVVVDHPDYVCLLMEVADSGSLRGLIDAKPELVLRQPVVQISFTHDIARGMAYLHSLVPPIIHHDLKPENVLLFSGDSTDSITAKISDFGLATGIATTTFGASSVKAGGGTTAYKAPEVFDDMPTRASDVYAFAIVCWELLSGDRPWAGRSDSAILGAVDKRGERPPMPSAPPTSSGDTPPSLDVFALLSNMVVRCWQQEGDSRPKFSQITRQLEVAISQMAQLRLRWAQLRPLFVAAHSFSLAAIDVFISFRFAEAHREALRLKAALEALGLVVFLSDVSPGGDLQDVIADALASCKLAIILATKTYGAKTNGLFDTSAEMNFIVDNGRKPFYLVRMIPFGEDWAESRTTMAFPSSVMQKLWLAGNDDPMPWDLVFEVCDKLRGLGVTIPNEAGAPAPTAAPAPEPQQSSVLSAVSSVVGSAVGAVVGATGGSSADDRV